MRFTALFTPILLALSTAASPLELEARQLNRAELRDFMAKVDRAQNTIRIMGPDVSNHAVRAVQGWSGSGAESVGQFRDRWDFFINGLQQSVEEFKTRMASMGLSYQDLENGL